jgi:hypothetical protein
MTGDTTMRADGQASVGTMYGRVGTVFENVDVVHLHAPDFQASNQSATARLKVARNRLAAGTPAEAAKELSDLLAEGHGTSEVCYYLALAIISGRTFDQLRSEDYERLWSASVTAENGLPDAWLDAMSVVMTLLDCQVPHAGSERDADALRVLDKLPADRQHEISRHLGAILDGALRDGIDARRREEVERDRLQNGRGWRVPLFFEPDPEPPRGRDASPPRVGFEDWLSLGLGAVLAASGLILALVTSARFGALLSLLIVVLVGGGGVGVGCFLPQRRYLDYRQVRPAAGEGPIRASFGAPSSTEVDALLDRWFTTSPPRSVGGADAPRFIADSAPYRAELRERLLTAYADLAGPVAVERLTWLVRAHAERVAEAWVDGGLRSDPTAPSLPVLQRLTLGLSLVALGVGVFLGAGSTMMADPVRGLLLLPICVVAAALLDHAMVIYLESRRYAEQQTEYDREYSAELAAYHAETERLSRRPSDSEMAEWLEYDKDHVRIKAMRLYGLSSTEIVDHAVLAEPAPGAQRARAVGGPARYSEYHLQLFLMTAHGVRRLSVRIHFASGAENKPMRTVFRYDAIAALTIHESSVRPRGRRQVADPEGGGPTAQLPRPILHEAVELRLVNSDKIEIKVDFDSLMPMEQREDRATLRNLALETSNIVNALRKLESVAAEGRGWIERERDRRRRGVAEYARSRRG